MSRRPASSLFFAAFCVVAAGCDAPAATRRVDAAAYPGIVASAARERSALAAEWRAARGPADEAKILDRASAALVRIVSERILPAWDGTPWSLGGTASAPGRRPIACGYLVSTALEHAGLRVERARLAQQAAEHIVTTLVPSDRIARFRRASLGQFLASVIEAGDGVYLVGLDYHVGFLVVRGRQAFFHHASRNAGAVVREPAILSGALARSNYRVVGKLFDRGLARAWLTDSSLPTRVN